MRFHLIMTYALIVIMTSAIFASCTPPAPKSQISDLQMPEEGLFDFSKCACDDSECWRSETAKKTAEQLRCAKDTLSTAFPVMGTVADLIVTADSLTRAKADLATIESAFKEGSNILKLVNEFGPGCTKGFAKIGAEASAMSQKTVTTLKLVEHLSSASDVRAIEFIKIQEGSIALIEVAAGFGKLALAMSETLTCLDKYFDAAKAPAQAAAQIQSLTSRMKSFSSIAFRMEKNFSQLDSLKRLNIIKTLGNCGVRIVKGLHTAINNAACLASDFETLRQQRASIINQTQKFAENESLRDAPNAAAIKADNNLCLGEARGASVTLMGKLGAYSAKLSLAAGYRESSSAFAQQCANTCSANTNTCSDFLKTQDFGPGCSNFCGIKQSSSSIAACISTCCLNDSDCRASALEQAGYASVEINEARSQVSASADSMGSHCGQGDGRRELVRDISSTYGTYTPRYETCSSCCAEESFEGGSLLAEEDRPACVNICILRGRELGKSLTR